MSHIATEQSQSYPWYVRLIFWLQRRRYGAELEPARLWGRSPRVFATLTLLYRALDRDSSPLPPALRSLLIVRVSQINWCEFCVDLNSATATERHVAPAKLAALPDYLGSPLYSDSEKAALSYAEAMTYSERPVIANLNLTAALKTHFSDDAIIELTALIAFQNLSSKFNAALGVEPQGFCQNSAQAT